MNWVGEAYLAAALHRDELNRPAALREEPDSRGIRRWLSSVGETFRLKYCAVRAIPAQECFA